MNNHSHLTADGLQYEALGTIGNVGISPGFVLAELNNGNMRQKPDDHQGLIEEAKDSELMSNINL